MNKNSRLNKKYRNYLQLVKTNYKPIFVNKLESLDFVNKFIIDNISNVNIVHIDKIDFITLPSSNDIEEWYSKLLGKEIISDMFIIFVCDEADVFRNKYFKDLLCI